ncbi:MAG: alpha/beta fold hydrolase [Panacagrimonas sp.]
MRTAYPALLAVLLSAACSNPPYPRDSVETLYASAPQPTLRAREIGGRRLHYAQLDGPGTRPILFVHGSPGDWKAWARYLDAPALAAYGVRIAMDRPGFGGSDAGQVMPDLRAQAALLAALIPPGPPAVLVGHSLGGPVVAWMALDHPDRVCGVVMVAGSVAPQLEAPRWYNRLADSALLSWLVPQELRWSNQEIMQLQSELQRLDAHWSRLQTPLVAVQGMRDELVDPRTVDYLQARVVAEHLKLRRVVDQGHFVLWDAPQQVLDAILELPC